jgi:integrase
MDRWEANFDGKLGRLKGNTVFNKASRKYVLEYIQSKKAENVTCHRLNRVLDFLWHLLSNADYDLKELSQDRIDELVIWINSNPKWADWTRYTYVGILSNFTVWLNERYKLGLTIKIKRKTPKNSVMPQYLPTAAEMEKILNGSDDPQTRLFFNIVYESGARISEILTLQLLHVSFNAYGARLSLRGKTGQRIVPVVWNANSLREFIQNHPLKEKPDSNLWYFTEGDKILPIRYDTMRIRLKRLCKELRITKRIHFHLLRHQRLTEMAKCSLGESNIRKFAGWADDSRVVKTYINLSNVDVENSILEKMYGIKTNSDKEEEKLRVCAKCNEVNPYFFKICQRCKTPLNEKELMENVMSQDRVKEIDNWSETFKAFLKVVGKKHPDIWSDMKEVLKGKEELLGENYIK